jgi:hypothetical protein
MVSAEKKSEAKSEDLDALRKVGGVVKMMMIMMTMV